MNDILRIKSSATGIWREKALPALMRFVERDALSPSFDHYWEKRGVLLGVCREAAAFGSLMIPGASFEVVQTEGIPPCLFMSAKATGRFAAMPEKTVLFYGHLDKQPPTGGWDEGLGPWSPVIRGGRLYGRGAADDGYSFYGAVTAIKALEDCSIAHPACVGIFETCEESGSDGFDVLLSRLRDRCGSPAMVTVLDLSCADYKGLWLTRSLRGHCAANLTVEVLSEGMHSGTASGVVPSSFDAVRILLDRIQDPATGDVRAPSCSCGIPEEKARELEVCAKVLGDGFITGFPWAAGTQPRHRTTVDNLVSQCWKPALSITGAAGLPLPENAGNVLRPFTTLKLSMRLPPAVDAKTAIKDMEERLLADPPFNARVSVTRKEASPGWIAPPEADWFREACDKWSMAMWGRGACRIGEGASIGIMPLLEAEFNGAQFVLTGALGPGSNAHCPNESLDLDYTEKLICCISGLAAAVK